MTLTVIAVLKSLLLPPTSNFILILFGLMLGRKVKWLGQLLWLTGLLTLVALSLRPVSYSLISSLERYPSLPVPVQLQAQQAIVVLGAGINPDSTEFGRSTESARGLQRLHYAAFLHEQTGLPVLVSGGYVDSNRVSEAAVMSQTLRNSFDVATVWEEQQSINTAENASYSAALLQAQSVISIYLVTHAPHMPRAMMMFLAQGLEVTPAPVRFAPYPEYSRPDTYLPSMGALYESHTALHEYLGLLWYRFRYPVTAQ